MSLVTDCCPRAPVHVSEDLLPPSDLARCLPVWLWLMEWSGSADDLLAALPHAKPDIDLTDLRNTLAVLGYPTRMQGLKRGGLDLRCLPAILLPPGKAAVVVYRDEAGQVLVFDGATGDARPCAPEELRGTLILSAEANVGASRQNWFSSIARRFRGSLPPLLAISGLMAVLGLAVPIFTMAVFDTVVAGYSPETLPMLIMGVAAAVVLEILFRVIRQRALLRIAERLDRLVPSAVFTQLLSLPTALVERAGTASQMSRLRDFAAIREFLTGSFAVALLDLPFTILVVVLMVVLGGWIALVPVGTAVGFVLLFWISRAPMRLAIDQAARANQAREALAVEALETVRTLKLGGAEERWIDRYAAAAAAAATASARVSALTGSVLATSQALVTLSGLAAVVLGVLSVLSGAMTAGALIAGMMLIWRVLGPMQTCFVMLSRWEQTQASIRQVDGLMALETERPPPLEARMAPPEQGAIVFHRVTLRYLPQSEPVLAGASFGIQPGQVVAVTGAEGTGKSTLLLLTAGLYRPQGGLVRIDGHDVRSFNPAVLRRSIGWVPQSPGLLYGTIAQNLRLARPSASDAQLRAAAAEAGVLEAIEALPRGFDTRVGDNHSGRLPRSILQRIALASALLREAPILLLDEPVAGLDDACAKAFTDVIASRRGRCTILMATHRPSHIRLADRVLRLRDGQVEEVDQPAPSGPRPTRTPVGVPLANAAFAKLSAASSPRVG
ncbi:ATP-binding cassette subfamily C protein/ATP-binding cassette subfamily C protein LapB [Microvirga lupini]|uniref:ATP-binding cassette subfamily C protein/ATP-binding cassette subfamily C protein LapB n=1 Tax=Microvirga lupini TaxID=420324 RepID=A0A7W4YX98_9HYPH|nr:ABC transporter transmembrane domain-containing protein [Microvirga lupini]MBB3020347.1 ATP-binding cassette subfamily C protein/ATP-binding cassette subfamily C protein LapB [Microvirga lupini]